MAQYIYTMNRVAKIVPPKRFIIRDISLSFFPGAKIGVLGLNGAGKSTVLRIMAGLDTEFEGEARPRERRDGQAVPGHQHLPVAQRRPALRSDASIVVFAASCCSRGG